MTAQRIEQIKLKERKYTFLIVTLIVGVTAAATMLLFFVFL